ncbi:MAG: hypothetical protein R2695_15670 [Acidimicrobiales bacterium]
MIWSWWVLVVRSDAVRRRRRCAAGVEPGHGEEIDLPFGVGEPGAHVGRGVDVDHAGPRTVGAEDGEAVAVVGDDLGMDTGPARTQRTDELGDEPLAFEPAHAADHGEPRMEFEGEGVLVGLDD